MVIVQDQRPRDWTYKVAFKEKDLPSLQEMVKHIRETHDTDMIEDFNKKCEQKLAGQTATLDNGIEIEHVDKTEDLVVNVGLDQCIRIILGTSTKRWSQLASTVGAANIPPSVTNVDLDTTGGGPFFISLSTYGWSEAKGMKLFFGAIGSDVIGSSEIGNIGILNGQAIGDEILNRENFYSNKLTRTRSPDLFVYTSVFLFSCVIEFCPVA